MTKCLGCTVRRLWSVRCRCSAKYAPTEVAGAAPNFEIGPLAPEKTTRRADTFVNPQTKARQLHFAACACANSRDKMITKFMTEITARFNPFSTCAKPARLFLTLLPPNARTSGTVINTVLLPRTSNEAGSVAVKFSMGHYLCEPQFNVDEGANKLVAEDGKELKFNTSKYTIKGLVEEVDRHSRKLQKKADLTD